MKRLCQSLLVLTALCCAAAGASGVLIDGIAATVDNEVILVSDLMREVGGQLAGREWASEAERDQLLVAALQQAIEERILVREALLGGIDIGDDYIEEQVQNLRELYPSNEAFAAELAEAGETLSDFRSRLRRSRMAQVMAYRKLQEFQSQVVVSESDVAQYYADNRGRYVRPERVRVRQIFLAASGEPERARARTQLDQLRDALELGADFAELARTHSEAPGAEDGGIIGWVQRGDLVAPLEDAAFSLGVGGISGIVETPGGLSLLKVEAREEAGQARLEEVRTEIEPALRREAAMERYNRWLSELRKRRQVHVFL